MRKSETSNPNAGPSFQAARYRPNWFAALICFAAGAYLLVALVTYDPGQSGFRTSTPVLKNPGSMCLRRSSFGSTKTGIGSSKKARARTCEAGIT